VSFSQDFQAWSSVPGRSREPGGRKVSGPVASAARPGSQACQTSADRSIGSPACPASGQRESSGFIMTDGFCITRGRWLQPSRRASRLQAASRSFLPQSSRAQSGDSVARRLCFPRNKPPRASASQPALRCARHDRQEQRKTPPASGNLLTRRTRRSDHVQSVCSTCCKTRSCTSLIRAAEVGSLSSKPFKCSNPWTM
jgi:hypothetical protein